jgi:hypothetical protein
MTDDQKAAIANGVRAAIKAQLDLDLMDTVDCIANDALRLTIIDHLVSAFDSLFAVLDTIGVGLFQE